MEEEGKPKAEETKPTEAKITLTKEVSEMIEENFRKMEEKFALKQKAFKFHGSETTKQEATKAAKEAEVTRFIKAVATHDHATAQEISNKRAESIGLKTMTVAGSAGSDYLVPTIFETAILGVFDSYDEIIRDADVRTVNAPGNIFNLNELDTRVTAFYADENSVGLTASQPTYSEPQIAIADLIGSTDLTLDFLEDTEVDIMADLARQYGEAMAKQLQARLINGDVTVSGVVTKGILNSAGLNTVEIGATATGYSGITANDIENLYFDAIAIDHFQDANKNGTFYMSPVALQALRSNIRSSSSDRDYISIFDTAQMTLLGRPLVLTNQMPTPATTVSNPFVVYGNLSTHLIIRRKRGMTMKLNDSGTSKSGKNLNYQLGRELVVSQRVGHQVVLAEGLSVLVT